MLRPMIKRVRTSSGGAICSGIWDMPMTKKWIFFSWKTQNATMKNSDGCCALMSKKIPDMQSPCIAFEMEFTGFCLCAYQRVSS